MRIEIYNDGKELQDIKEGKAWIQPEYYGVSTNDGHTWRENNITVGFGTDDYWFCIIKFKDVMEAINFKGELNKIIEEML